MYTPEMIESCAHALREYDYATSGTRLTRTGCRALVHALLKGDIPIRNRWDQGAHDVVIATARALGWPRA